MRLHPGQPGTCGEEDRARMSNRQAGLEAVAGGPA